MKSRRDADHHEALHAGFRWQVPTRFNWYEACCARWARWRARARAGSSPDIREGV